MLNQPVARDDCGPTGASELLAICRAVREHLPNDRYRHVLGVARTAERLARRYGSSPRKARVAALIHDIARMWTADELFDYARAHDVPISEAERRAPVLLHSRIGAHIAHDRFGINDADMLAAIERHTVAVTGMSDLQKILYIADTIEPSRTFAGRATLEQAADRSLDEGMLACIESSMEHLKSNGIVVAPLTLVLHQQLVERREART